MRSFLPLLGWVALLALPLSGCIGDGGRDPPLLMASGLFTFQAVERGDPGAVAFDDCAALRDTLAERALDQARIALDQGVTEQYGWGGGWAWRGGGLQVDAVMASEGADSASAATGSQRPSASGAQVTGTNNQESAADEADLVKTDGEWTYVLASGVLHILHSDRVGDVEEVSNMTFGQSWGGQLLLAQRSLADKSDDRLVLVLPSQMPEGDQPFLSSALRDSARYAGMTRVVVLSLTDREAPEVMEDQWIEGYANGARLVDGHAYVVVQTWEDSLGLRTWVGPGEDDLRELGLQWTDYDRMDPAQRRQVRELVALKADLQNQRLLDDMSLEEELPTVLRGQSGYLFPQPVSDSTCRSILSAPQSTGRSFVTVLALDVAGDLGQSTTQVVGGSSIVYADTGELVLAGPSQDSWWFWAQPQLEEATDLLWFSLDGLAVEQRASGRVPGSVLDSFSLDVHGDELRVATTLGTWGRWWVAEPVPMTSQVMVLHEEAGLLLPTGSVGGIAPGERIWSARFTDERAYLVTFRQTDPLWIVDLRGGIPNLLGELKVPGVSTYLHPIGEDLLLAIGYGPGMGGLDLDWSKVEVSLFDVSDPRRPVRADVLTLSPAGGSAWSGAAHDHLAFTYWEEVGTLAVPMTTQQSYEVQRRSGSEWVYDHHVAVVLVEVDTDAKDLRLRGEVDQDRFNPSGTWSNGIERSYFLGYPDTGPVSVYAISQQGVTAHDLETLQEQDWVAFPPRDHGYGYWID